MATLSQLIPLLLIASIGAAPSCDHVAPELVKQCQVQLRQYYEQVDLKYQECITASNTVPHLYCETIAKNRAREILEKPVEVVDRMVLGARARKNYRNEKVRLKFPAKKR